MAKNKIFEQVPLYDLQRSKFDLSFTHRTSIFHGDLVPVGVLETMAHDTFTVDVSTFVRMSTPIAPIMGDIDLYIVGAYVPARILWDNWTKFYGADDEIIDISMISNDLRIPKTLIPAISSVEDEVISLDYFRLSEDSSNLNILDTLKFASIGSYMVKVLDDINLLVNALPFRAYYMTWNWLFRNENLQEPILIDLSDGNSYTSDIYDIEEDFDFDIDNSSINGIWINPSSPCLKVNKHGDRFTTSLPWPQKGDPAVIGLADLAPVITGEDHLEVGTAVDYPVRLQTDLGSELTSGVWNQIASYNGDMAAGVLGSSVPGAISAVVPKNLYADLRQASAVSINQLRIASAVQRMLEKDAIYGTRYDEKLMAHFGTAPLSEVLNQPQYLGGMKTAINIDTVLQTTGHQAGATSTLAEPGAVSMTYNKGSLFTQSFTEPGYILLLAYTRHKREYSYIDRLFLRDSKLDFYWPELAHVGYSPVYDIEINNNTDIFSEDSMISSFEGGFSFNNPDLSKQSIFGYQEYANEYRYKPNMVSGFLNPSHEGSLDFWTLADNDGNDAYLTAKWIQEDRKAIARALTTGENGPDYIVEFNFKIFASRPMPAFGLPGLSPSF